MKTKGIRSMQGQSGTVERAKRTPPPRPPKSQALAAAGLKGQLSQVASKQGITVEEAHRRYIAREQAVREKVAERTKGALAAQAEAIQILVTAAPGAARVLVDMMNDENAPHSVRRLCAMDVLTISGAQKAAESVTKTVHDMSADELAEFIQTGARTLADLRSGYLPAEIQDVESEESVSPTVAQPTE